MHTCIHTIDLICCSVWSEGESLKCVSELPAKVAEFEDACLGVEEEVLRLDVSVTHTVGVDVGQRPKQLVHVHL